MRKFIAKCKHCSVPGLLTTVAALDVVSQMFIVSEHFINYELAKTFDS